MTDARVERLVRDIQSVNAEHYALVQAVRKLVSGLHNDIVEEVKYGGVLFGAPEHFSGVFTYTKHVSVEFGDGAQLTDKYRVLEGSGKLRRHIKLHQMSDIENKHLLEYLMLAHQHALKINT